jgi:hypothetical protein
LLDIKQKALEANLQQESLNELFVDPISEKESQNGIREPLAGQYDIETDQEKIDQIDLAFVKMGGFGRV